MSNWDSCLYSSDDALDARGQLIAEITLPVEPEMFAACVGLLTLLDPGADQLDAIATHAVLPTLPQGLREAAAFAAQVDASGPRLPYSAAAREVLGIDASYGRLVDPLLELRETIMIARAVREHCVRAIDEGFAYGETALGGPLGLLLELRELGVATSPDLVDEWITGFDGLCADISDEPGEYLRAWTRSFRSALQLLATEPDRKLLGSDPTMARRNRPAR